MTGGGIICTNILTDSCRCWGSWSTPVCDSHSKMWFKIQCAIGVSHPQGEDKHVTPTVSAQCWKSWCHWLVAFVSDNCRRWRWPGGEQHRLATQRSQDQISWRRYSMCMWMCAYWKTETYDQSSTPRPQTKTETEKLVLLLSDFWAFGISFSLLPCLCPVTTGIGSSWPSRPWAEKK